MTKGDCLALMLRYLDEATKKGIELPETKNADYRDKFNYCTENIVSHSKIWYN